MKKILLSICAVFTFIVLLMPAVGVKASASSMPSAGAANLNVIDISHYNVPQNSYGNYLFGNLNWTQIHKNISAVYIKATEGTTYTDPCFKSLAASAQSAGVSHGFYHFFWPNADPAANRRQADYFYNTIKNYGYDCVPVLDIEETNAGSSLPGLSKAQITNSVKAFADEFKSESGRDIMIYTYNSFINEYFDSSLSKYKLWVARYGNGVNDTNVWHNWDMWQYGTVPVGGIPAAVDGNKATGNIFLNSSSGNTWIDAPSGTLGAGDITVSGWAISYYGVSRVDIYVDGTNFFGSVPKANFSTRTDVQKQFGGAGYDDSLNSGFSYSIPDGTLSNGTHTVKVAAVDNRGNAVWSSAKTFNVSVPENKINLDIPSGTQSGNVAVSGWALSRFGLNRVDVYVDGRATASVMSSSMTERTDVESMFAGMGYKDMAHSGFYYSLASAGLSDGSHVVQVVSIDNKGKVLWSPKKAFTYKAPSSLIRLDRPSSGTYTGDVTVSGWALSHYGISRVDIYFDGKAVTSVMNSAMTERTDVERKYGNMGYNDTAHSGFSSILAGSGLQSGNHVIRVVSIDKSGKVLWSSQNTFTVKVSDGKICLDKPSGACSGDVTVSGWAISHYGIKRVDVYIDGKATAWVFNADMSERTDVERIYGNMGYNDMAHSGFSCILAASGLHSGNHTIKVVSIDGSGKAVWSPQKTFTVS